MTYRAAASSSNRVKSVNSATFVIATTGETVLEVNQTQYVGRYPTLSAADEALRGLLLNCGCRDFQQRFFQLNPRIVTSADITPVTPAWGSCVTDNTVLSYGYTSAQVTGISVPIFLDLEVLASTPFAWYKVSSSVIAANASTAPAADGYTQISPTFRKERIVVAPNQYLAFKTSGELASSTITVKNYSAGGTLLDSIPISVTEL